MNSARNKIQEQEKKNLLHLEDQEYFPLPIPLYQLNM